MNAGGAAADERVNIGPRLVPQEPMAHASFALVDMRQLGVFLTSSIEVST